MGCYGIGPGRIMAAAVEQGHDEYGIAWPRSLAPYDVESSRSEAAGAEAMAIAERLEESLLAEGLAVSSTTATVGRGRSSPTPT